MKEEKKAWALIEQGYDGSYNGDAYGSVMYQNENLSVRVSDAFMTAAEEGKEWWTRTVTRRPSVAQEDAYAVEQIRGHRPVTRVCTTRDPEMAHLQALSRFIPPTLLGTSSSTTPPAISPR
jgi:ribonucleoside-diphosphate reductase alpha chain